MTSTTPAPLRRFASAIPLVTTVFWLLGAAPAWATKVTFQFQPVIGGVSSVSVAGSFNAWDVKANPLKDGDKDGLWVAVVDLAPGKIEYKFVVNGDQWMTDENAAAFSDDGFGGKNAVLELKDKPVIAGHGSGVAKAAAPKAAAAAGGGLRRVTFKFHPQTKPTSVAVAGAFNNWEMGKTPLEDPDGDGIYEATLLLPAGEYMYKFVVNGSQWTQDREHQDSEADDGFGGKNSVIRVDDRFGKVEVKQGDGNVFPDGVGHTQSASEVNNLGSGRVQFTARAHHGDVNGIDLVTWTAGAEKATAMPWSSQDQAFDYYRAEIALGAGETPYVFRYRDGAKSVTLSRAGLGEKSDEKFVFDPARFPAFETPQWVKDAVIYQIFPDRFRNGSTANDQDFKEWYYQGKNTPPAAGTKLNPDFQEYYHLIKDWNDAAALTQAAHMPTGRDWMSFYGGDLAGVREKLDYLKDLGVTAIYFNPIFEAKSSHKYDCADFKKIDPHFGTNEEFIALVKEAKSRGIRVILDIVYNHSGNSHWAFKDAVEKGPASETYGWYEFKKWPLPQGWPNVGQAWKPADYYYCWWGFGDLPDLNFDLSRNADAEKSIQDVAQAQVNIGLVNYLLDTTQYWLETADVDGVRLDVPNEVPFWFWKLFNQRVKKVKPDAYIVGELWGNAADYVKPGLYDAVMNYAFHYFPIERFLCKAEGNAAEFDATLATGRQTYPTQAVEVQMNLISSHDKPRYVTRAHGDLARLKLAAMFQMTYVGAPTIYYGDEVGLEGGEDPDNRRPFPWDYAKDPKKVELRDYYKKLTAARHASAALRTGTFRTLYAEGMVYGYARGGAGDDYVVALNAGAQPSEMPVDVSVWGGKVTALDVLTGKSEVWSGTTKVKLAGETGRLFKLTRGTGTTVGAK